MSNRNKIYYGMVGNKFSGLTVINILGMEKGKTVCLCVCDCGTETIKPCTYIFNGRIKSCGCRINNNKKTHGLSYHPIYRTWIHIKTRCYDEGNEYYDNYGGRGIKMCERWLSDFSNFYNDMIGGYKKGLSIDRIDVNGDYCPENCRWANRLMQDNNRTDTIWIEIDGVKKPLVFWAKEYKISHNLVRHRIWDGWNPKDAVLIPRKIIKTSKPYLLK